MRDTQLYSEILGIEKPWKVGDVKVSLADDEVEVTVTYGGGKLSCPQCGKKRNPWSVPSFSQGALFNNIECLIPAI